MRRRFLTSALLLLSIAVFVTGAAPSARAQSRALYAYVPDQPPTTPLPTIFSGHPRLIVGGYRGTTIAKLKERCASPKLAVECAKIGGEHILGDAMAYLLRDDAAAAARVVAELRQPFECSSNSEHSPLGGYALAYDWVHGSIKDASVRRQIAAAIGDCALDTAGPNGVGGNGPHLWHGYTALASGVALAALAVDEDYPKRQDLLTAAVKVFRQTALEAYQVTGGAWPEGYNYERSHFFSADPPDQYVMDALRAWDSAVQQDHPNHASLFETIRDEEGDWLRGLAYHLVYGTIPPYGTQKKRTLLRGGDLPTGQAYPNKQYRPFVDSIATVYKDWFLKEWGDSLEQDWSFVGGEGTYHSIHRYSLPYNLPLDMPIPEPNPGIMPPIGRIWGRDDLGYILARSSWTDADPIILGYRAGKWMTGHQHMDQGHIDLWYNGPILVDSGVYASWGTPHREGYYLRSVAHNTLLIHMNGELFDQHPSFKTPVNDDGQRVHTYTKLGCAQCIQSVAEWRQNIGKGMHFEAGKIEAFEAAPRPPVGGDDPAPLPYTVIASDLTAAYNSTAYSTAGNKPKVELVQRDVTMIGNAVFVADRVRTAPGAEAPRFVMHTPKKPYLGDRMTLVEGTSEDGISTGDETYFQMDNGTGGLLLGETAYGPPMKATVIGGPNHRYWVDGADRGQGASGLEGSPAEPGSWRIEIGPAESRRDTLMVHGLVLQTSVPEFPVFRGMMVTADPAAGPDPVLQVQAGAPSGLGTMLTVFMSGAIPRKEIRHASVRYSIQEPTDILLRDLVPNARYAIRWTGRLASPPPATSSPEGVLLLHPLRLSAFEIGLCPPPSDAGAGWRELCGDAPVPSVTPSPQPMTTATRSPTPQPSSSPTPQVTKSPTPTDTFEWDGRLLVPWAGRPR